MYKKGLGLNAISPSIPIQPVSLALFEGLTRDFPDTEVYQRGLIGSLSNQAAVLDQLGQPRAAEAVYRAAQHDRRELWVGYSTVQAIVGNKLLPWAADRYLAAKAIRGQQVEDMPVDPDRPDNLYEPVPEKAAGT